MPWWVVGTARMSRWCCSDGTDGDGMSFVVLHILEIATLRYIDCRCMGLTLGMEVLLQEGG